MQFRFVVGDNRKALLNLRQGINWKKVWCFWNYSSCSDVESGTVFTSVIISRYSATCCRCYRCKISLTWSLSLRSLWSFGGDKLCETQKVTVSDKWLIHGVIVIVLKSDLGSDPNSAIYWLWYFSQVIYLRELWFPYL